MRNIICYFAILSLLSACTKNLNVEKSNYLWKNLPDSAPQSINLDAYKSPNSRIGQDSSLLVILCATGGGSRAASFTIGALLELEKILLNNNSQIDSNRNVLSEIDFFSTASGGGWGASSFISFLYQKKKYGIKFPYTTYNSYEQMLANYMDRAYARFQLSYFLGGIFSKRKNYISNAVMMDRLNAGYLGWVHMKNIEENIWKEQNIPNFHPDSVNHILLGDVFTLKNSESAPALPMFITNATNLTNYMLVPFSPDRLHWWGVKQYNYSTTYGPRLFPSNISNILTMEELSKMPLVAGVKASSSVPGFIGSSVFKSEKDGKEFTLRLEDGGITDNFGLHTAISILNQEKNIVDKKKRIVIIVDASAAGIRSSIGDSRRISRLNSVGKFVSAAPDAQYPLTRERIRALEILYNCTVIYLGTEVLLDTSLGAGGVIPEALYSLRIDGENLFYSTYNKVLENPSFYNSESMNNRSLLYEYIRTNVSTWFSAKRTNNKGRYLENLDAVKGTARIMTLAGRAVVQLKKEELFTSFQR